MTNSQSQVGSEVPLLVFQFHHSAIPAMMAKSLFILKQQQPSFPYEIPGFTRDFLMRIRNLKRSLPLNLPSDPGQ